MVNSVIRQPKHLKQISGVTNGVGVFLVSDESRETADSTSSAFKEPKSSISWILLEYKKSFLSFVSFSNPLVV